MTFPIGATLDGGRFVITEQLAGHPPPERGLYRGREVATAARVLVSVGGPQRDRTAIATQLAFDGLPRVAKLRHVGPLSEGGYDGIVEDEPDGVRASEVLRAPVSRETACWVILEVARIATAANERGIILGGLRPELIYLWGTLPQVVAVAPRCEAFLAHARSPSSGGHPCFEHLYASPEVLARPQEPAPAHADAFSLFAILGQWLTADYPFVGEGAQQLISICSGRRAPWRGNLDDGELIERGLLLDLDERSELPQLISALEEMLS
jgi:hypothetical protein